MLKSLFILSTILLSGLFACGVQETQEGASNRQEAHLQINSKVKQQLPR